MKRRIAPGVVALMDNSGDYEFIDVFVRRPGRWMAVHAQLTRIAPQGL
jgi:hypothetical protein